MPYRIQIPVSSKTVPDWQRNPPKWAELVDAVFELNPGQALPVVFNTFREAKRARDAVRDAANLRAQAIIVRTRVIKNDDNTATLYLTRVNPSEA